MLRLELKLDTRRIKAFMERDEIKKLYDSFFAGKKRLRNKLTAEKKSFAAQMELRPNFYKLRPLDKELQNRHENFKLTPIANTTYSPEQQFKSYASGLQSAVILHGLQDTASHYRENINRKYLSVAFVKKREQDKLTLNYRHQMQLKPC